MLGACRTQQSSASRLWDFHLAVKEGVLHACVASHATQHAPMCPWRDALLPPIKHGACIAVQVVTMGGEEGSEGYDCLVQRMIQKTGYYRDYPLKNEVRRQSLPSHRALNSRFHIHPGCEAGFIRVS